MRIHRIFIAAAIALLSITATAATLVVPAAGTGPGAAGSQWESELTLHNAAPRQILVSIEFHRGTTHGPVSITLGPRATVSINDIVKTRFGILSGSGALVIGVADRDARALAVTSRVSNVFAGGDYGQDVPAIDVKDAVLTGEIAALPGPSTAFGNRFNFGIYPVDTTTVTWQLVRANGTIAASRQVFYAAYEQVQYGSGIETLLGVTPADNDTVYANVDSGQAIFYGSIINALGDPSYVPGIRTRDDILILFAGVDLDENGTVDLHDANADGILDTPIVIYTSLFPSHFRIAAEGEFGEHVTFEIVSTPTKTDLLDDEGAMRVVAMSDVNGTTGEIRVKATSADGSSAIFAIPVLFK